MNSPTSAERIARIRRELRWVDAISVALGLGVACLIFVAATEAPQDSVIAQQIEIPRKNEGPGILLGGSKDGGLVAISNEDGRLLVLAPYVLTLADPDQTIRALLGIQNATGQAVLELFNAKGESNVRMSTPKEEGGVGSAVITMAARPDRKFAMSGIRYRSGPRGESVPSFVVLGPITAKAIYDESGDDSDEDDSQKDAQ